MELTQTKKDEIELEYNKLKSIIDYVTELSGIDVIDCTQQHRDFIVNAGIAIYSKMER